MVESLEIMYIDAMSILFLLLWFLPMLVIFVFAGAIVEFIEKRKK